MVVKICVLLLIAIATGRGMSEEIECVSHNMEVEMYRAYQQALEEVFNDTDTLYYLQRAFYPPNSRPAEIVYIEVATTVRSIVNSSWPEEWDYFLTSSCKPGFVNYSRSGHGQTPCPWFRGSLHYDDCDSYDELQWSKDSNTDSHLLLVTVIQDILPYITVFQLSLGSIFYVGTNIFDLHTEPSTLRLNLTINQLSQMPSDIEVLEALSSALTWVKYYARPPHDIITQPTDSRGQVTQKSSTVGDNAIATSEVVKLVIIVYAMIYVFLIVLITRYLRKMFCAISERMPTYQYAYSMYWGSAFICGLLNLLNFTMYCGLFEVMYYVGPLYSVYVANYEYTDFLYYLVVLPIQALVCAFELCLCVYATRGYSFPPPKLLANVFCCCCVFSRLNCHSRMIHTLALANIVWFVQTILMPGLFVTVFYVILAAAQTIAIISLTILEVFCAVIFATFIVHKYKSYHEKSNTIIKPMRFCLDLLFRTIVFFMVFCIIIATLLLYLSLVSRGLGTAGIGGTLVALIPSTILSLLGFAVKRKLFGEKKDRNNGGSDQVQQPHGGVQLSNGPRLGEVAIQMPEDTVQQQDEMTPLSSHNRR